MTEPRIVIVAGDHDTTNVVYHFLAKRFDVAAVFVEQSVERSVFLKRRLRNCGLISVIGQMLFVALIAPLLRFESRKRASEIFTQFDFSRSPIPPEKRMSVDSINNPSVSEKIQELSPSHVIVWGTRIISTSTLESVSVPFINIHVGITPMYRGSHGGYWALASGDPTHCGVTVHAIDSGIDTGEVLAQKSIYPSKEDNFETYPHLQLAAGLNAIEALLQSLELTSMPVPDSPTRIWYHPTLWGYLFTRVTRGVK